MKQLLLALLASVVLLAAVLTIRTARVTSNQPPAEPAVHVAVDAAAVATHLAGAVRIVTVSHDDPARADARAFLALRDYLRTTYPRVHAALAREEIGASLLFTWQGADRTLAPVVLMAHQDVVPAAAEAGGGTWQHEPFSGDVADGFVWGRGTLDDKGSLIAIAEAVEKLVAEGFQPRRTIYLAFGHDEEAGGTGASAIAAALRGRGVSRYALVEDEGSAVLHGVMKGVDATAALIGIAEKGYVDLELKVWGTGGHSSMPPAETSIGILSRAVARLQATPFPASIDGPVRQMFEQVAPAMSYGRRLALANLWLFGPLVVREMMKEPEAAALLHTTLAPTVLKAGLKANVLPPEATAVVNLRLRPGDSVQSAAAFVRRVIDDERVRVAVVGQGVEPSPVSDTNSPAYAAITRAIRQVLPADIVIGPMLVLGATDSRAFAASSRNVFRFMPVVMGGDDLPRIHGMNERISIDGLATAVRFYYQLLKNGDGM